MWFTAYTVLVFFYNHIYNMPYANRATTNQALVLFCKPFMAAGAFLSRLGTIILTVLQLPLQGLYYIVVPWLLVYMLNLLYHFIQYRDFTLQGQILFWSKPLLRSFWTRSANSDNSTSTFGPMLSKSAPT